MSNDVFIFEITENTFQSAVIENSRKLTVVTLFMGVWSEPCFILDNTFTALAKEFAGQFIYAKIDIDEQTELRRQYAIENVPTIIIFQNGEIARADVGQLNEDEARELLAAYDVIHESDTLRLQAREKHLQGDTQSAILLLTQAIQKHPGNIRGAMDMVQIFLDIGDLNNAAALLDKLPEQYRDSETGKALKGQLTFAQLAAKTDGIETLQNSIAQNPLDHQARFDLSLCYVAKHDCKEAMEQLLRILEHAPEFNNGAAREMMIAIIQMLKSTEPELANEYQRKLSSLLAQ